MSWETIIESSDEQNAPPDQPVLSVTVIGDDAYLQICEWEEVGNRRTTVAKATIAVPLNELVHALQFHELSRAERNLRRSQERPAS
jgi:hypothetical protein